MLDENLPSALRSLPSVAVLTDAVPAAFVLKPSSNKPKQNSTFLYSQYGSEFEPSYTLRHLDPDRHASRNRYAAALYDAFNPEVLYAEVLLIPEWTQPSPHADQARMNDVPPPPEPVLPSEFTIQLYNPDQQVLVRHKAATWNTAASWEFEMPQQTFRTPSASALDRGQHDPAASEITPKIGFKWKKDSKLSKDLACFLSGKSTNPDGSKKKNREPDITVAIFKGLKEVTLYEPNLPRVEMEDLKGFEVVLLLGAVVIRDVYFGSLKETFNLMSGGRRLSTTSSITDTSAHVPGTSAKPGTSQGGPMRDPRVPPTDPLSQWEIDVETARLRRQAAEEERNRRRREEGEEKKIRKMLEDEERERRRRQAEVDKETERLRRLYWQEDASARPTLAPTDPHQQEYHSDPRLSAYLQTQSPQSSWGGYAPGPYMSGAAAQSTFLSPASPQQPKLKQKSSIFSFRRKSDDDPGKIQKKRSSLF